MSSLTKPYTKDADDITKTIRTLAGRADALLGMVHRFSVNYTEYFRTHRAPTKNCSRCGGYLVQVQAFKSVYWAHSPVAKGGCSLLK
jgi:hypothetical protein